MTKERHLQRQHVRRGRRECSPQLYWPRKGPAKEVDACMLRTSHAQARVRPKRMQAGRRSVKRGEGTRGGRISFGAPSARALKPAEGSTTSDTPRPKAAHAKRLSASGQDGSALLPSLASVRGDRARRVSLPGWFPPPAVVSEDRG